jgi:hypothetical protein
MPPVSHQALPGAVRRLHRQGRLPGPDRADRDVPRGPPGDSCPGVDSPDAGGLGGDRIRACGGAPRQAEGHRADDGVAEDGRPRRDRGGRSGPGPPGYAGGGAALRGPWREDGRAGCVPARCPTRDGRRHCAGGLRAAVLRARDVRASGGARPVAARGCIGAGDSSLRPAAERLFTCGFPGVERNGS